jgi:hypothetical protein
MKNKLGFWLAIYFLTFPVMAQATVGGYSRQDQLNSPGQRIVTGTIEKIANNKITVKTDEGRTHDFTIAPAEQSDYMNIGFVRGDRVILSYNHRNQIMGLNKIIEGVPYNKNLWLTGNKIKF